MLLLTLQVVWKELTKNIKKVKQTIFLMSKFQVIGALALPEGALSSGHPLVRL